MLKTLFGGSPKWQSANAEDRLIAINELDTTDQNLQTLALKDEDAGVRTAAVLRSTLPATFAAALADPDHSVREAAAKTWALTITPDQVNESLPLPVIAALRAFAPSDAAKALSNKVAANDLEAWLLTNAPIAAKVEAIKASSNAAQLNTLHLYWRDHDKRLGKACADRLSDLDTTDKASQEADVLIAQMQSWSEADEVPLSKLIDAQRAFAKLTVDAAHQTRFDSLNAGLQQKMQNESLSRRMHETLAMQVAGLSLKAKKVAELNPEELSTLVHEATAAQSSPVLDAALAQQLQGVHAAIAEAEGHRERNAAGEALLAARPVKPSAPKPPKPERVEKAEKAVKPAKTVQVETATSDSAAPVEAVIASTPALAPAHSEAETLAASPLAETANSTEAVAEPIRAAAPIEATETTETIAAIAATTEAAPAAPAPAAPATASAPAAALSAEALAAEAAAKEKFAADSAAYTAWHARWETWISSVDTSTRDEFTARLASIEKPERAEQKVRAERPVTVRASDEDITNANTLLDKLGELIAAGEVRGSRSSASNLYKLFTAKRYPKIEEQRLHELDGEVKRLESWLKWSDGQARDGLLARAESLKGSPLPPDQLAKELRAIQEEWKALDKKNGGAPKPKWDRFNALCKEAYAPAKAYFDELRKKRNENAGGREKIITDLHALADEAALPLADGEQRDWAGLERRKAAIFDLWKKAGGVANADWKALDDKFDVALKKLDNSLDSAREPEITRRKKLIQQAVELAAATPSREVTERTIAIQRMWGAERPTNLPHLRRKDEQKLWDEFKKHTDAVFKGRDAQRDQMKAQFSEATKARFDVIDKVKTLAELDDTKAIEAAVSEARSQWRNLPMVDREKARDLDRKFDDAVAAARKKSTILSRGSVIAAMKATLEAIAATESPDKTAAGLVIDAELISGIDSPAEIATARRTQQLRWLSERRQLPTAPDAKITAMRTLLGAFNATSAKITLGERERLTRAIEAVGAA